MRRIKQVLALILAAALTAGTMSMAFGQLGNPIKAFQGALGMTAVGVSSVEITNKTTGVERGKTETFKAKVMAGASDISDTAIVTWTTNSANKDTKFADNVLTVASDEIENILTVTATCGSATDTLQIDIMDKLHVHDAACLADAHAYVMYMDEYGNRMQRLSMDTSEAKPISDYAYIDITCKDFYSMGATDKVTMSVVGKFKDVLSTTAVTSTDYAFATRLELKDGQKILGSNVVEIEVTVNGVKLKENAKVTLYAEPKDPVYSSGGEARFTIDMKDIKNEYSSTIVPVTIPGGVRAISAVTIADTALQDTYRAEIAGDGFKLIAKAGENNVVNINEYNIEVMVAFKARTAPISMGVPVEVSFTNTDAVELTYTKEIDVSKDEKSAVTAVPTKEYTGLTVDGVIIEIIGDNNRIIREGYSPYGTIEGIKAGDASFNVGVLSSISIPAADGKTGLDAIGTIRKDNNPIKVVGASDRDTWLGAKYESLIDINKIETYATEVKLDVVGKPAKITAVTYEPQLVEYKGLKGNVDDFFTVGNATIDADGKAVVKIALKNEAITLDCDDVTIRMVATLDTKGTDGKPLSVIKNINLKFIADAPLAEAYAYGTQNKVSKETIAVGDSRKYDIKVTGRTADVKTIGMYVPTPYAAVVRGQELLGDRRETETITINARVAMGIDRSSMPFYCTTTYIPKVIGTDSKIIVKGDWRINDLMFMLTTTDGSKPVDPDDNDGGSGSGSGSNSGDNVANKPETSDKITNTVDAVKDLDLNKVAAGNLPAGVVIEKTAGGSAIATIPMNLTSGSASLNASLMETMGAASSKVGLKLTVSTNEMNSKDSVEIIIPGGFGKINEAGRLSYPMDYKSKADDNDKMLAAVKTKDAISTTAQIGGNFTLPTAATITVNFTAPEGSLVNIYKFDPITGNNIYLGQGKVIKNKLTFATKMMGQMLFTTGKI